MLTYPNPTIEGCWQPLIMNLSPSEGTSPFFRFFHLLFLRERSFLPLLVFPSFLFRMFYWGYSCWNNSGPPSEWEHMKHAVVQNCTRAAIAYSSEAEPPIELLGLWVHCWVCCRKKRPAFWGGQEEDTIQLFSILCWLFCSLGITQIPELETREHTRVIISTCYERASLPKSYLSTLTSNYSPLPNSQDGLFSATLSSLILSSR